MMPETQHWWGPGELPKEAFAEDIGREAFRVESHTLRCTRCTVGFDKESKLEDAIEHYRGHLREASRPAEVEGSSAAPHAKERQVKTHRERKGRIVFVAGEDKKVVFNFKLPPGLYQKLKSQGTSIRPFVRNEWEAAVKSKKFPQSNPGEKLQSVGMWMKLDLAEDIVTRETNSDFNFDWWVTEVVSKKVG